jgi:hypothetical protein
MERSWTSDIHSDRSRYVQQVHAFPMLTPGVEQDLSVVDGGTVTTSRPPIWWSAVICAS